MTHLSDLSFLQRMVMLGWFLPWYIIHIYRYDRFEAFRLKRLKRLELRSLMTLQLFLALLLLFVYDIGTARIKYWEGFWLNPQTHEIIATPTPLWSKPNQEHIQPLYYTLSLALAFQNCLNFLLQSWWHYITSPKASFQRSFEFRLHIVASIVALITYPLLQFLLRNDVNMREAIPQLVFSSMLLVLAILGVRTHFRLKRLLKTTIPEVNEQTFILYNRLEYFSDINKILICTFTVVGLALGILSIDGMTEARSIAHNKFASDFLISNLNFMQPIMWAAVTLLFYPRKSATYGYPHVSSHGAPIRVVPHSSQSEGRGGSMSMARTSDQHHRRQSTNSIHVKDTPFQMEPMPSVNSRKFSREESTPSYIPYVPPTNPEPVAVASPTRPSKPRIETTTLYYCDGLARHQQQSPVPLPPTSTEHLLRDVDSHDARVRPLSLVKAAANQQDYHIDHSMQDLKKEFNNDPTAVEEEEHDSMDMERPISRTRIKPDTQTLSLHYGPLYQQLQSGSLESPATSTSSSSTTMVSGSGGYSYPPAPSTSQGDKAHRRQHSRQISNPSNHYNTIRPVSPGTPQPQANLHQQMQQQYDAQYGQPRFSNSSEDQQRRGGGGVMAPREKRSIDSDMNIRTARRVSINNAYSLKIIPQHSQPYASQHEDHHQHKHRRSGSSSVSPTSPTAAHERYRMYTPSTNQQSLPYRQNQQQQQQQQSAHHHMSHGAKDVSRGSFYSDFSSSGSRRADSSMGEITIQLQAHQQPHSSQQRWV